MERQAISISLNDLKLLKKELENEIKELRQQVGSQHKYDDLKVLFPIVNNQSYLINGKKKYCSDSWQFEGIKGKGGI